MLKEENMQLSLKVSTMDATHTMPQHQRVNDLEQTVLTLRGNKIDNFDIMNLLTIYSRKNTVNRPLSAGDDRAICLFYKKNLYKIKII